jgi:hypothetical protein
LRKPLKVNVFSFRLIDVFRQLRGASPVISRIGKHVKAGGADRYPWNQYVSVFIHRRDHTVLLLAGVIVSNVRAVGSPPKCARHPTPLDRRATDQPFPAA